MTHRNPGLALGVVFAAVFLVLILGLDARSGAAVFLLLIGVWLVIMAWLPWARLGLRWSSVGMAASGGALIATSLTLLQSAEIALRFLPMLVVALAAAAVLMLLDRKSRPHAWERWQQALHQASFLDVLLGRHLPRRDSSGP